MHLNACRSHGSLLEAGGMICPVSHRKLHSIFGSLPTGSQSCLPQSRTRICPTHLQITVESKIAPLRTTDLEQAISPILEPYLLARRQQVGWRPSYKVVRTLRGPPSCSSLEDHRPGGRGPSVSPLVWTSLSLKGFVPK